MVDVYTPHGATIHRQFNEKGEAKATPLKPPKMQGHTAMIRHFRQCILGQATPSGGGAEGVTLMRMVDAIYKSAATGKSRSRGSKANGPQAGRLNSDRFVGR